MRMEDVYGKDVYHEGRCTVAGDDHRRKTHRMQRGLPVLSDVRLNFGIRYLRIVQACT